MKLWQANISTWGDLEVNLWQTLDGSGSAPVAGFDQIIPHISESTAGQVNKEITMQNYVRWFERSWFWVVLCRSITFTEHTDQ